MQPLEGIRVVELANNLAGAYAGRLLAGYGADVIKIESASNNAVREAGPFIGDDVDLEKGAFHLHLNANKRSVLGDIDDSNGQQLLAGADILLHSESQVDVAQLREKFPQLVILSVTSWGMTGPYAGFKGEEIIHYAYGGPMSATGNPEKSPLKMGGDIGQYQCGNMAAVAALAALSVVERSGQGVHVDLSNIETQVASIDRRMTYLLYGSYRDENVERTGGYTVSPFPMGCRPASDGHVQVSTLVPWIGRMLATLDDPEMEALYSDPDWITNEDVPVLADAQLLGWTVSNTRQEAMEKAQGNGWPVTAVNAPLDVLNDKHFAERKFFTEAEHPQAGTFRQVGAPIRMTGGWSDRCMAPTLGADTNNASWNSDRPSVASDEPPTLPLEGVRVLDMTVVWAGPYATQLLGDLGADIVRVDNPWIFPTVTRGLLPRPPQEMVQDLGGIFGGYPDTEPGSRPWNRVALFNAHSRNKRSITLDLRKDLGRETFLELIETCDVMIENNSVDLIDKLGIGWDELHERNPNLILIRMPSVGLSGPYRSYLGFGVNFEALCGLGAIRGYPDADLSENDGVYHMDAASGSAGALAALMALRKRDKTGVGELVELSQCENMLNHIGELLVHASQTNTVHGPLGNRHRKHAPQGCYETQGDDQWIVISVTNDDQWRQLCALMDADDMANDVSMKDAIGRQAKHEVIDERIREWTESKDAHAIFDLCQLNGIPAAPVLKELDLMSEEHLLQRGLFAQNGNEEIGFHTYPTHPWRWTGPELNFGEIPTLGQHNKVVLQDLLNKSDDEYRELEADGHLQVDYLLPDGTSQ